MKKPFLFPLILSAAITLLASSPALAEDTLSPSMRIMVLKGPTALGMLELMEETGSGAFTDLSCEFTIAASADEVTPRLVQGDVDVAAVPANLASVLYNNMDGGVKVLAINTLGVLYIVENGDSIASVEDLKGKTIYASGKGATPEYALNYILSENGIDPARDVTIEWKSEHTECLAALLTAKDGVALLPQPFVTTAQMKNEGIRTALDLTEEWEALQQEEAQPSALLTGVLIARSDFVESYPQEISDFLDRYRASVDFVNANPEEAAALSEQYDIVPAQVAVTAIPACNITFIEGEEMQEKLSGYLSVLLEQNPKSIGGALPEADFYYNRQS